MSTSTNEAPAARARGGRRLEHLLHIGVPNRFRRAETPLVKEILKEFRVWERGAPREGGLPNDLAARLVLHLNRRVGERADRIAELHRAFDEFTARHSRAGGAEERQAHILDFAATLDGGGRALRGDRRAFRRWFGFDAMVDRYRRRVGREERRIVFAFDRMGLLAALHLSEGGEPHELQPRWRRLDLETTTARLMGYAGDGRVRAAAFRCLARALRALPAMEQERVISDATLRRINRTALEPGGHPWTDVEALSLLSSASPATFDTALALRLERPGEGDDFFVRRKAVVMLCESLSDRPHLARLIPAILRDESPAVRQALAFDIWRASPEIALASAEALARDASQEVRAALLTRAERLIAHLGVDPALVLWRQVLREEEKPFVLRTALHFADEALAALLRERHAEARVWREGLLSEIERLHVSAKSLAVRRWAAQTRERIWARTDPEARALLEQLARRLRRLKEGRSRRAPELGAALKTNPLLAGRVLSVLSQTDFNYDLAAGPAGPRVTRGERFRFRLWRLIHEFRHPSTDKRQAFDHTAGRIYYGSISAPSAVMAELAQTKVPGEPLFMPEEAGWRPYLPLADHALSAIDTGETVRLCTSEGVTEIEPPKGLVRRLRARLALSWGFERIANLRNWSEARSQPPTIYLNALKALGFRFRILPYPARGPAPATEVDPAVARFFPVIVPLPLLDEGLWRRAETYFYSVYQNSLQHLAIFIGAVLAWFVGRHIYSGLRMRRIRQRLPLVLGGWGTRGKSGTERLKAGLLNGLGYGVVSKTTGCEAMFLHGDPFGQLREMFLFRPYDKATIWEQMNVAGIGTRLKTDVFLWECMGLTPSYVKILQRHWMRDDVSTITNTYPDHEDLQGPAGRNIPEVMTNFIPKGGTLLTTEEQMRPILADAARDLGTRFVGVGWLEAGLLPPDALKRFPYEEHPFNIALVLALADELGVDRDFALKEMADRVVPDLGVLKAFEPAPVRSRRLEFVNGMSANERFGALSNWERMGFDRQDPEAEPGVWIMTVVNNRADRVPRSRVFASILANDISADRHVLIGSNLEGLQGYIEEAWEERAKGLTLWPDTGTGTEADPLATLTAGARWMRVARDLGQVRKTLHAMLENQTERLPLDRLMEHVADSDALERALKEAGATEAEGIVAHHRRMLDEVKEHAALAERIRAGGDRKALDHAFAEQMGVWFKRKVAVVEDFYATGEAVVDRVRAETPPGFHNRVMGVQNIKGTGLDFVYRWQAWDTCQAACRMALSGDPGQVSDGVRTLSAFQEFGVLSEERVRSTLAALREAPPLPGAAFLDQLDLIEANLNQQMAEVRAKMTATKAGGRMGKVMASLEQFLDAGDAVRRRRKADRIYRDLIAERISHDRAALELKKLNSRQKGGWLADRLQEARRAARQATAPLSARRRKEAA